MIEVESNKLRQAGPCMAVLAMLLVAGAGQAAANGGTKTLDQMLQQPRNLTAAPAPEPARQTPVSDPSAKQRGERAASRMLELARQDIAENRQDVAQRVLELLIERYPDSSAAEAALHDLGSLQAMQVRAAMAQLPPPSIGTPGSSSPRQTGPGLTGNETAGRWQTRVVSQRRLQDDLRGSVGDRVFFGAGSADLGGRARAVVTEQAQWLQTRPDVEAVIEGHADDMMAGADNDKLAAERAVIIRDRLIAEGVAPHRIAIRPMGASDPVATCADSECAAQNRRSVLKVSVRRQQATGAAIPAAHWDGLPDGQPNVGPNVRR